MQNVVEVFQRATNGLADVIENLPVRIEELNKTVSKCDGELNDLQHLAELENFNASQGFYIAKQIQKASRKRRAAKDELEVLFGIRTIMNNNSKFDAHINGIKISMRDQERKRTARTYKVRVRTDLNERFSKCTLVK
jgi:hypothetical protein